MSIDRRELIVGTAAVAASAALPLPEAGVVVEETAVPAVLQNATVLRTAADPLGYDMSGGVIPAIRKMAEDALAGVNQDAVEEELAAVRRAFGR